MFEELELECQFNQGSLVKSAQTSALEHGQKVECQGSSVLAVGTHKLDIYSQALSKYVARDITVNVRKMPQLVSV